jgi:predicted permease
MMDELIRNLRYAIRTLRKNPAFSVTAIVSLALGIGVNTLVFSAFESLLLRPLPITDPERVVSVETGNGISHSFPNYREFRDNASAFSGLAGYRISPMSLERAGSAERIWGYLATGNYFDMLGVKPALGRFFHQQDDVRAGASPYAVLSYNSWQARFGGDPGIVGKSMRINGLSYNVLGIAPRDFHGTELFYWPEIWVPMMMQAQIERGNAWLENPYTWDTWILGRLKPGITLSQAGTDLNRIASSLAKRFPDTDLGLSIRLSRPGLMGSALRGPVRLFVGGLLLLAGLVLMTACANLGGLLLARSADRGREMAIRLSIGAGRGCILRQLLTEALTLAFAGGLAGCALAVFLCRLLSQWHAPMDFPVQFEVTPDWRVFVFAAAVSAATGVLFGLGPALQLSRTELSGALKGDAGRTALRGRFRFAFRDLLVATEIGLCFVLVFGATLSLRALQNALVMPLGFNPTGVTTAAFDLGLAGYNQEKGKAFQEQALEAVKALPGVTSAAYANSLPLSIDQSRTGVQAEDAPPERGRRAKRATFYQISPDFLSTLSIPLLSGRDFRRHDNASAPRVAIVNRAFARQIMHTEQPVGKAFRHGPGANGAMVRVIGLVEDGKYESLTEASQPALFWPMAQQYNATTTLVVKSARPASEVLRQIRRAVAGLDGQLPIYGAGSLASMLGFALFPMQAAALTLGAFGILALVLAITGIHGFVAYAIARRTREIGVRIALGARPAAVLRFVLGRMAGLVAVGLVAGVVLSLAAGQALRSVIYGVSPGNPGLMALVLMALVSAAGLACWRPARRAIAIDPVNALRCE